MNIRNAELPVIDCLPPVLREAVIECSRENGAPEEIAIVCALGAVSAALGKGLVIESGPNRITRGNLFLVAGAPSGIGKSVVYRMMLDPLLGFEKELAAWWKVKAKPKAVVGKVIFSQLAAASKSLLRVGLLAPAAAGERLLAFERSCEQFESLRLAPRLTVDDVTAQALMRTLFRSGETLLWASPDARHLLKRMAKSDSAEESLLLKAFSGDPISVDRVTRDPVEISSPSLSCLMLSQPKAVAAFRAKAKASESGLFGRFLFANAGCWAEGERLPLRKKSDDTSLQYAELIRTLIETFRFGEEVLTVLPNDAAEKTLQEYGGRCRDLASTASLESEKEVYARREEQAWRISLVLHAARHGRLVAMKQLDRLTANSAICLLEGLFPVG